MCRKPNNIMSCETRASKHPSIQLQTGTHFQRLVHAAALAIAQNAANRKYTLHKSLQSRGTDKVLSYYCKQIKTGFVLPERQHIWRQLVRRQMLKFREELIKLLVYSWSKLYFGRITDAQWSNANSLCLQLEMHWSKIKRHPIFTVFGWFNSCFRSFLCQ